MVTFNLITEAYFRSIVTFNTNVDAQDISTNIPMAMDMFLEPILGSSYYDYIQTVYSAQTLTANETVLMNYIKPLLAWKTAVLTLPFLSFNIKNKGIQTQKGDFSDSVEKETMFYIKKELNDRAEWYHARLEKYLYLNATLFPTYQVQASTQNLYADKSLSNAYDPQFATYDSCHSTGNCNGFNGFFRTYP